MGKNIPKMLIPVNKKPLLYWTLKNLEKCNLLDTIILTVPPEYKKLFQKRIKSWHFKKILAVTEGGKERVDSTKNALKLIPQECELVGIHDGARPFVSSFLMKKCFDAAKKWGAAILAVPSKDTVKIVKKNGEILKTIPRDSCWSAQTPQIFKRKIAESIHFKCKKKMNFTDDASIAELMGYPVKIVPGNYENLKITTPEDLILAEAILKRSF